MKEYRVRAYFSKVYTPRTYRKKVTTDLEEARRIFKEAVDFYNGYNYLIKVVLEEREVSDWETKKTKRSTKPKLIVP